MADLNRVRELFSYNPETGVLCWRKLPHKCASNVLIGTEAGEITNYGYRRLSIDGERYVAHRIAWLYFHGRWPKGQLDHKDGNKLNNAILNLRESDAKRNRANTKTHSSNVLGIKGVQIHESGKYRARIFVGGRNKSLGLFEAPEKAHEAYCLAALHHFKEFARFS